MRLDRHDLDALVAAAARPIPLLWPLSTAVAVNPLWDLRTRSFPEAVTVARQVLGIRGYPPASWLEAAFADGRITTEDLASALGRAAQQPDRVGGPADLDQLEPSGPASTVLERLDRRCGTARASQADAQVSRWCAAFASGLLSPPTAPSLPFAAGFYATWRADVTAGRLARHPGLARLVASLGPAPEGALVTALERLGVREERFVDELSGQLARQPGWAAHAKWRTFWAAPDERRPPLLLLDYLAVRLACDLALATAAGGASAARWPRARRVAGPPAPRAGMGPVAAATPSGAAPTDHRPPAPSLVGGDLGARLAALPPDAVAATWLEAYEHHYATGLLARLAATGPPEVARAPRAQVLCCIDTREEGLRRHLERDGRYETFGIAGFFGVPARVHTGDGRRTLDLFPVLVHPGLEVRQRPAGHPDGVAGTAGPSRPAPAAAAAAALEHAREHPVAAYPLAEAAGLALGPLAALRTGAPRAFAALRRHAARLDGPEVPTVHDLDGPGAPSDEDQATLVAAALGSVGLTACFAPLVVLCGHGSTSENNPFASALDCGACGAQRGGTSARLVAAILNRPPIRSLLVERGIVVPDDTLFVAAEHDTTTDSVVLFPPERRIPTPAQARRLAELGADLAAAGAALAAERSATLAQSGRRRHGSPGRLVAARAIDWSEVQPEWGLARCAALVVAPRRLTAGLDLERRVFLHSYDGATDRDGQVLEAILSGPMVVAHWISAAYYFSTVDPDRLGAGDKAAHNVVGGDVGVYEGLGGDLRIGLPRQAVLGDDRARHEPMRLLVVVDAPRHRLDDIIARTPVVAELVDGRWVHLVARDHGAFWRRAGPGRWCPAQ